ncbi:Inorganic pyrophosphatase [Candidatus Kinetoplastibacterium sorsogonicusi]|uniref:Inorganic pyrophosphatase n=1 Tax=Candidatus Kinetoplastidibacterium kentomonadis TaxID=1576550 RepID=A0A3Q8EU37_9PROT|nr:inorganic diphosphatase [Candidatus Kinetoplastibacterium sorsogonicusi]AWD32331.1 Inorganic pyrophosphatase [Candidatus Kinetoplastibacterium sorsogonicusi]
MSLKYIDSGIKLPDSFNVIIEISMNSDPVKYEVDKDSGVVFVDRFMLTSMRYPCNYGYIPETLSDDGDPSDVLVITPYPIQTGTAIKCRAIGLLDMEDESGQDKKILALPIGKIYPPYNKIISYLDLSKYELEKIQNFFEHYKDLEKGKWVKVNKWENIDIAHKEILDSHKKYIENSNKS